MTDEQNAALHPSRKPVPGAICLKCGKWQEKHDGEGCWGAPLWRVVRA